MTIQQAADKALMVQNGVNLSGIVRTFSEVLVEALWPEARLIGEGTDWVNTHPIATAFICKLADLNSYGARDIDAAYRAVEALAK
jgi:hypothetical protein